MPSATDELREKFPGGDDEARVVLLAAGFKLTRQWTWIAPKGHEPTQREIDAINYLADEWDYGGLE